MPRGHLRDLDDSPALPGGWHSFPRRWQVPYPLAGLFSSPGRRSRSPCCAPAAQGRGRPAAGCAHTPLSGAVPAFKAALPSHAGRRCCGPGSHGWLPQQPPPGGTGRGGGRGSLPCLSGLGGRWVPGAPGPGPQLPLPRRRPPCPGRGLPGYRGAAPGAAGRAGVAGPAGGTRGAQWPPAPGHKSGGGGSALPPPAGPPGAAPPAATAATMGRPPPPLRRVLLFLSILVTSLLPLAGSAAGAGTRRAREPGLRGAGRCGERSLPHPQGLRGAPAASGELAHPPARGSGGWSPATEDVPVLLISRWCILGACGILVTLTAWGALRPEGPCTAA